jgi:23S rRNA (uracil1939-C5)-methyltransferase
VKQNVLRPAVLLDPPRAGAKEVVKRIDPAITNTIVYVSCNIATFARDALHLQEKGYRLVETQLVDMFPQTHHVESVSLFTCAR